MVTDKTLAAMLLEEAQAALVEAGVVPVRRARSLQAACNSRRRSSSSALPPKTGRRLDDEILWNDDFFDDELGSVQATKNWF